MAEMIIMLRRDKSTGKQNIIVKLDSDPDALPMEHEDDHKALVQKVVGKAGASRVQANEGLLEPVGNEPIAGGIEQKS